MKKIIIISVLLSSYLYSGIFNHDDGIKKRLGNRIKQDRNTNNKDSQNKNSQNKNSQNKNSNKFQSNNYQIQIDNYLKRRSFNKLKDFIEFISIQESISPDDKQKLFNYIFENYLIIFINKKNLSFYTRENIKKFLIYNASFLNEKYKDSNFNLALLKIIEKEQSANSYIKDYNAKYFPNGIDEKYFFVRFFSLLNSDIISDNDKSIGRFYQRDYEEFINNSPEYSENLLINKLKYDFFNNNFHELKINSDKVLFNNKFSSDGYYYLGEYFLYQKEIEEYKKNMFLAIKMDKFNSKAYFSFIHYSVKNKYDLNFAIKLSKYFLKISNNKEWDKKIKYELALAYYKHGIDNDNYDLVLQGYFLFKKLNKKEFEISSLNILKKLDPERYKTIKEEN